MKLITDKVYFDTEEIQIQVFEDEGAHIGELKVNCVPEDDSIGICGFENGWINALAFQALCGEIHDKRQMYFTLLKEKS